MNALPIIVLAAPPGGCAHNPQQGGMPYRPPDPDAMAMIRHGADILAGPRPYYRQPPPPPMFQNYQVRPTYPGGAFPGHYTVTRF